MTTKTLDASGLNCPLPILKAKKELVSMDTGNILSVISTDAGSIRDFIAFCNQTGNTLTEQKEEAGKYYFKITKA